MYGGPALPASVRTRLELSLARFDRDRQHEDRRPDDRETGDHRVPEARLVALVVVVATG